MLTQARVLVWLLGLWSAWKAGCLAGLRLLALRVWMDTTLLRTAVQAPQLCVAELTAKTDLNCSAEFSLNH